MKTYHTFKILYLLVALALLGGCSTSPVPKANPLYAGVRPAMAKALPIDTGSIYKAGYDITLFESITARQVGDILTVMLSEKTNASQTAKTKTTKDSDIDITLSKLMGQSLTFRGVPVLDTALEFGREFEGKGDTSQSNSITGSVTVTITEVLANGNFVVQGEKLLTLNQGVEHIRVSGIIRQEDISPANTIASSKIANSKIIYGGEGTIAEANTKGWLQRLIDGPYWPF